MAYVLPGIPELKRQMVRDFPYAVPLSGGGSGAYITAALGGANNGLASVTVTNGGSGYPANVLPTVIVFGGGGYGAVITVTVVAGVVTTATLADPGYGYVSVPPLNVYISNGEGDNTDKTKVTDYDIASAVNAAQGFNLAESLFSSQKAFTYAYNLLAAHYLCETLQAAGTGLGGKAEWLTIGKTIGNVTENYTIPERVLKSPILAKYSKTTYGAQFLELVSPQLIGNMAPFHRNTLP